MFSLYLVLKFVHVAAVIAWIGGVIALSILTLRTSPSAPQAVLVNAMEQSAFYGQRVIGPTSGVVLLAGIAMVASAKIGFGTLWVVWGFTGIALHILLGVTLLRRNAQRLSQIANSPTPDRVALAEALARQKTIALAYVLAMLSVVWAMVTKPT